MSELVDYARSLSASRQARRYKVPTPGQFVKLPSVEVWCTWMKMNGLEVVGWRGDLLVVRRIGSEADHEKAARERERPPAVGEPA